jgi:hypothetical protein
VDHDDVLDPLEKLLPWLQEELSLSASQFLLAILGLAVLAKGVADEAVLVLG